MCRPTCQNGIYILNINIRVGSIYRPIIEMDVYLMVDKSTLRDYVF